MNFFTDANNVKAKKVVVIPPLYNNSRTMEFLIRPEKDLFYPNEVFLHFNLKVPAAYIVDNQSAAKLFDSVEITLNGCKITNRSCSNEYFLASYFNIRSSYPTDIIETSMRPMGYYSIRSLDVTDIDALEADTKAFYLKEQSHYEIKEGGKVTFRVYNIITPIMSPLFQQTKPLPPNMSINVNFKRSNAEIPLLQVDTDSESTYANANIDINDAYLECTYVEDGDLVNKYNFMTTKALKYHLEEPLIRTFTIDKGLSTATFNVNTGGKLPLVVFSALCKPEAFFGDLKLSATNFTRHDLTGFQLMVDNSTLPGSKVTMSDETFVEPYVSFLRNTKLYNNALAGKTLKMGDYINGNFILSYDLTTVEQESGWLSLKYDFKDFLANKLMVIVFMQYEKEVVINKDREVTVNN